MSGDDEAADSPELSRIRRWSRGLQGQLLKAAEHTETVAGLAEGAGEKIKLVLNSPAAQKIISSATSEPAKKIAIGSLYLLLPRPIRWAIKQELFEKHVRIHVFREGAGSLQISDQSQVTSTSDTEPGAAGGGVSISDARGPGDTER